jgi:hypothetical protein
MTKSELVEAIKKHNRRVRAASEKLIAGCWPVGLPWCGLCSGGSDTDVNPVVRKVLRTKRHKVTQCGAKEYRLFALVAGPGLGNSGFIRV